MYNYKMTLQYDGSRYDGWLRGKDEGTNTIEFKIVEVLKKLTSQEIELVCGCRTEKGVHACAQVANFKLEKRIAPLEIRNYLNRYLPRDIAVYELVEVDERFNAMLNAKSKTYEYRLDIANIADVFSRKYAYHTFDKPDFKALHEASKYFLGKHDFKAFTTAKRSKSTIKEIKNISLEIEDHYAYLRIKANDFMHNQARLMIGFLLDVSTGLKKPEEVKKALDGEKITMSLPAESYGLFLKEIEY
ncbi:tRNA pseudouridine(38-40) synthase TruA [Lachnospira multipara]|uniref:tRNA pseudouridine(38-40) synthase TruA n=1 Tax=Lachnospira multipara TaxID=28051 RepID=UPI000421DCEC|nr:tRNA pseudouridine(38-40) synthase TruA [Lachnospira multipara]